jgi:hypothetical protein
VTLADLGPPPPAPDAILTAEEVGAWLKVHPKTVRRLPIPYVAIGKRGRRYVAADVLAWIDTHKRGERGIAGSLLPRRVGGS